MDQLSCYFSSEHMYTLYGIFSLSAHVYYKTFSPIFKHESRFTSFMSFIYEFEHALFPSLDSIALGRLHNRVQPKKESVGNYFTDFADLIFIIGRNEEDYQQQFLLGLANKNTQYTVSNTIYPEGTRTLRKLADHAHQVEAQVKLNKAFRGPDDNSNESSRNISTLNNTGGRGNSSSTTQRGRGFDAQRGRGAAAPRGNSAPGGRGGGGANGYVGRGNWAGYGPARGQSLPRGGYSGNSARGGYAGSGARGGYVGNGARGGNAGNGAHGGANTMLSQESWKSAWDTSSNEPSQSQWQEAPQSTWSAQVNELTTEGDYPDVVPNNEASISSASASSLTPVGLLVEGKMRSLGLRGCGSCLSPHHRFDGLYDKCRELCPCCGIHLQNNDHLAIECRDRPRDKSEAIYLAKEAFLKGDPDKSFVSE